MSELDIEALAAEGDVEVTLSPQLVATLRAVPTDEELDEIQNLFAAWVADDDNAGDIVPDHLRERTLDCNERMIAARDAARQVVELVDAKPAKSAAAALAEAAEDWGQCVEFAAGYRVKMINAGFSEPAAEHAAIQMHTVLLQQLAS